MSNKPNSTHKLSKIRRADPQFEREKAQYDPPLPSREYVLETLAAQGAPLEFGRLVELLDVQPFEQEPFQRRLVEVLAGFTEHADYNAGRVIDEIEKQGKLDNTLIFYIWGDNGSSSEGLYGTISEQQEELGTLS